MALVSPTRSPTRAYTHGPSDSRWGSPYGPNLMIDPGMNPIVSVDWSYNAGTNVLTRTGSAGGCNFGFSACVPNTFHLYDGVFYLIEYVVSGFSGDTWSNRFGGATTFGSQTGNGSFSFLKAAEAANQNLQFLPWGGGAAAAVFSDISVRIVL